MTRPRTGLIADVEFMKTSMTIGDLSEIRERIAGIENPIVFIVEEGTGSFCGQVVDGTFGYRVGHQHPNVSAMIRDFQAYEARQGRVPLVFVFADAAIPHAMPDNPQDGWVVHATDPAAGASILAMRRLCSRHYLRSCGTAFRTFGRQELGEPPDYADLVNFAPLRQSWAEAVVASKQHGKFCSETDAYTPGVRFYFNIGSLMAQPNYEAFLGGHALRGFVELEHVIHCVVTATEVSGTGVWTPKSFTEAADRLFEGRYSRRIAESA